MEKKPKSRAALAFTAQAEAKDEQAVIKSARAASRDGKAALPFWVPIAAKQQLKHLATDLGATLQDCLTESLNDFFIKNGKPPIA